MADFQTALDNLLIYEGGYSNNSHDAGGETVFGISRVNQPSWVGWSLVDSLKRTEANLTRLNTLLRSTKALMDDVGAFYRQKFWQFDAITDQDVANKLFEMEVLFGPSGGIRILQEALIRLGHHAIPDGALKPENIKAMQTTKGPELMHGLRAYCTLAHLHHILARPDQVTFADGWFWRATA